MIEVIFPHTGITFPYYLGVIKILKEHYQFDGVKFSGTSAGMFPCVLAFLDKDIDAIFEKILGEFDTKESYEKIIRNVLEDVITEEDFQTVNGKVICKMAKLNKFLIPEKTYVSSWTDRKDMIECLVAGCHIPYITGEGFYYEYRDSKILDGWFAHTSMKPATNYEYFNIKHPEDSLLDMLSIPNKRRLIELYHQGILDTEKDLRLYRYMFAPKEGVWKLRSDMTEKELLEIPSLALYTFEGDWSAEKMEWAKNIIENR